MAIARSCWVACSRSGVRAALDRLRNPALDGFWIHLDADVLDDAIMPAVDYRMPDGLRWDELAVIPQRAIASGRAIGIDITIFNPGLDETGAIASAFVDTLASGLLPLDT